MKHFNQKPILLFLFTCLNLSIANSQTVRYVKMVASGNGSGSSWANASDDLQAIINASSGGYNDIIYVAEGTYKPIRSANDMTTITPDNRNNAFVLKGNIVLKGGYSNDGLGYRDILAHPTILSGDIGIVGDSTDNCYHVLIATGMMGQANIDGFIIRDGNANSATQIMVNGQGVPQDHGGGLYSMNTSTGVTMGGDFRVTNCAFKNNNALMGGGISTGGFYSSHCDISDCHFSDNTATSGGGIYAGGYMNASIAVNRTSFVNNTASDNGGAFCNSDNNDLGLFRITNCLFSGNIATKGGGIYNGCAAAYIYEAQNSTFVANSATEGSSIFNGPNPTQSDLAVLNCIFWGNNVTNGDLVNNGGILNVSYSVVENGFPGANNSNLDPLFTDATNGDYTLQVLSPAINMGPSSYSGGSLDLAGNTRKIGTNIDAGAYESPFGAITPNTNGIVFVNKSVAGGNGNGYSWETAVPELADALKMAKTNTDIQEIWVAKGTYYPLYTPATSDLINAVDRDKAFRLINNVRVYGGFQNANETDISQRDTLNLNTILSGNIGNINGKLDNSHHVVISVGSVGTACLNGFTIRDGYGKSPSGSSNSLIYVDGYSISKGSGGGTYIASSSPNISNCAFIDNESQTGGGIYISSTSQTLLNCQISNNLAYKAGGIYSSNSTLHINKCIIRDNNAQVEEGGGIYFSAGLVSPTTYYPTVMNTLIINNQSIKGGGAIYLSARTSLSLTNCTLSGNSGVGSVCLENNTYSNVDFRNTILWNNPSNFEPGAGSNTYSSVNSLIQNRNDFPSNDNLDGTNSANDPLFAAPSNTDFTLLACSPAINAGSNQEYIAMGGDLVTDNDLSQHNRLFETTIDMGAYESVVPFVTQISPTFSQVLPVCYGDIFTLPDTSTNGIIGVWTPTIDNSQTTTYTFIADSGQCASTIPTNMDVVVNPLDDASFDYPISTLCTEDTTIAPSIIITPNGTFSSTAGLVINPATGAIDVATSQTGNYVITHTTSQNCSNSSTKPFKIKDLPDVSFSYAQEKYCTSEESPTPIVTGNVSSFSSTPSGLLINSTTGKINLSSSLAGNYQITNSITASGNCPAATKTIILSVEKAPIATISLADGILEATEVNGATYQWINCSNHQPISGATTTTFKPDVQGSYAVVVTTGDCSTTSVCKSVSILGNENLISESINIYPNPTNGILNIDAPFLVNVSVLSIDGKIIASVKNGNYLDLKTVAKGIYLIKITNANGEVVKLKRIEVIE